MLGGTWATLFELTGQSEPVFSALAYPCDLVIARVAPVTSRAGWRYAGRLKQFSTVNGTKTLLISEEIELGGHLVKIYPVAASVILFYPVHYLTDYSISIEVRENGSDT